MDRSTDVKVEVAAADPSGDDWLSLGRQLEAADPEVYAEAREIVAELVERVRRRNATRVGALGVRVAIARA